MSLFNATFAVVLPIAVAYQLAAYFFFPWLATTRYVNHIEAFVAGKLAIEALLYIGLTLFLVRVAFRNARPRTGRVILAVGAVLVIATLRYPVEYIIG